MRKLELRNALLSRLAAFLEPHGFSLIRKMDWYIRKGESKLIFRLDFYDGHWKDIGYIVAPSVAVRIDYVEQIYHKVSGFEPKYQKDTPTIWTSINDLCKVREQCDYRLDSLDDVEPIAHQLSIVFRDIALPFVEENGSVKGIDGLLNSDPENEYSIFGIPEHRYFKGVIAAKLANNGRYEQIADTYRNKLTKFLPDSLADFDRLLVILEEI